MTSVGSVWMLDGWISGDWISGDWLLGDISFSVQKPQALHQLNFLEFWLQFVVCSVWFTETQIKFILTNSEIRQIYLELKHESCEPKE